MKTWASQAFHFSFKSGIHGSLHADPFNGCKFFNCLRFVETVDAGCLFTTEWYMRLVFSLPPALSCFFLF